MVKIALNGFGRIGKLALRRLIDNDISVAFINDKNGDPDLFAHLLEFDTVHGRWDRNISNDSVSLTVNNQKIPIKDLPHFNGNLMLEHNYFKNSSILLLF